MPIYNWDTDKVTIVDKLRSNASVLKLCVKVLDEPLLMESWIQHHARIVGLENLVIADNGSTDPVMLSTYRKYCDLSTIFRFDAPHNQIHWHPRFREFFDVINETCRYFSFVDVDEKLVWIDERSWIADKSIVERMHGNPVDGIIPTTWLINMQDSFDTFSLLDTHFSSTFTNNLKWGKPILPAKLVGVQDGIHNAQFDRFTFSTTFGVNLFLLHFTQLPARRISVNRNKLISRSIVSKNETSENIMAMDFAHHADKSALTLVNEMKRMAAILTGNAGKYSISSSHYVKLENDGTIRYSEDGTRQELASFLASGDALIRDIFNRD